MVAIVKCFILAAAGLLVVLWFAMQIFAAIWLFQAIRYYLETM